jgi:hypothetical protein
MARFAKALGSVPLAFVLAAGAPRAVGAQDRVVVEPSPAPPGHLHIIVEPPTAPAKPTEAVEPREPMRAPLSEEDAYRHAELSWSAFRSRNIFIGSSAATAVGAALVFPAEANQCGSTDEEGEMTLNRCTPGGKAMVLIGYPLLLFGGISMLASGIAFGVTKGKLRRFEQRVTLRESRALRWDPAGSRFVF